MDDDEDNRYIEQSLTILNLGEHAKLVASKIFDTPLEAFDFVYVDDDVEAKGLCLPYRAIGVTAEKLHEFSQKMPRDVGSGSYGCLVEPGDKDNHEHHTSMMKHFYANKNAKSFGLVACKYIIRLSGFAPFLAIDNK